MVVEIKFIKSKRFNENWEVQNQKFGTKNVDKKFALKIWKDT